MGKSLNLAFACSLIVWFLLSDITFAAFSQGPLKIMDADTIGHCTYLSGTLTPAEQSQLRQCLLEAWGKFQSQQSLNGRSIVHIPLSKSIGKRCDFINAVLC